MAMNTRLLLPRATSFRLNWRVVGPAVWNYYRQSILRTTVSATVTNTVSLVGAANSFPGGSAYLGGVLLPDGRVFCVPFGATQARVYDPTTNTVNLVGAANSFPGDSAYVGGVLLPDGRAFCAPHNTTQARVYDPATNTVSLVGAANSFPGGSPYIVGAYIGGVLLPDGRVFCVPSNATQARVYGGGQSFNTNVLLSTYFNKL